MWWDRTSVWDWSTGCSWGLEAVVWRKYLGADFSSRGILCRTCTCSFTETSPEPWLPAMKEDLKVEDGKLAKRINDSLIEWEVCLSWLSKWQNIMACACNPSTQEVREEGWKSEASLSHIVSSRPSSTIQWDSVSFLCCSTKQDFNIVLPLTSWTQGHFFSCLWDYSLFLKLLFSVCPLLLISSDLVFFRVFLLVLLKFKLFFKTSGFPELSLPIYSVGYDSLF